jgi:hypothetical protein
MLGSIDRSSARVGAVLGLGLGLLLAAGFAYSNLGPSAAHPTSDDSVAVLGGYVVMAAAFATFGFVVRRWLPSPRNCAIAGAVAGVVALLVVAVAIGVINNVWLSTVARQPDKIYGLAHDHMFHTMRAYLNGQLALGLVVLPPVAAAGCALLTGMGALVAEHAPGGGRLRS